MRPQFFQNFLVLEFANKKGIIFWISTWFQALRVETANPLYFSAYIIRLRYKVADFVV